MSASAESVPNSVPETASITTIVADWMSATNSRIRITTELAFAEARLAAISVALMVLMGTLSAVFVLGAWGLVVAGLVYALLQFGRSLWLILISLSLLHALSAWLLLRGAVRLSSHLNFASTRQQFPRSEEVTHGVDTTETIQ